MSDASHEKIKWILGFALAVAVQLFGIVWWASTMTAQNENIENRVSNLEGQSQNDREVRDKLIRIETIIEQKFNRIDSDLSRMEKQINDK